MLFRNDDRRHGNAGASAPERAAAAALAAQDALLDRALEETFPASDPISPMCPLSFR